MAALGHREPDRTPMFEYVLLSPLADYLLKRKSAADPDNWSHFHKMLGWRQAVRQYALDALDLACRLEHDMLYLIPNPPEPTAPKGEAVASALNDDPVERLRERNRHRSAGPTPPHDSCLQVYCDLMDEMRVRGLDLPILAPAYAHGVWTDTDLMQCMLLAPDVAHEHFRLATRQALALAEAYLELGIDQIGVGGDIAGNDPIISPRLYREFILPEVREVARYIHARGGFAITASDGNLWPIIDDWLTGCEVDGYLEIDKHAGMDLALLKQRYGDSITFYGNMDPGLTLSFASPDEIRQETIRCLESGMGDGGHIFCCSNAITASIPLRNYLTMIETYREYFGLEPLPL